MSQISPSGEGIDPVIESGDHQHAPRGERMARLEGQFQFLAKEDSVGKLRSEVHQLRTEMVAENKQLRTEMTSMEDRLRTEVTSMEGRLRTEVTSMEGRLRADMASFATKDDVSKEIHKARNWLMAAMFGVFAMLATQQLQLWALMQ